MQQAEPVAWLSIDSIGERYLCFSKPLDNDPVQPLYTHPPQQAEPVVEPVTKATLKDAFFKGFHSVKLYYGDVETSVEEEWEKFMQQAEPVADDETGNPSY
jgi:hypothetical protein